MTLFAAVRVSFVFGMACWLLMIMALMGCTTSEPVRVVRVTSDTFCTQATQDGKFAADWVPEDTPETATKIEKLGAKYQAVCGVAKSTKPKR